MWLCFQSEVSLPVVDEIFLLYPSCVWERSLLTIVDCVYPVKCFLPYWQEFVILQRRTKTCFFPKLVCFLASLPSFLYTAFFATRGVCLCSLPVSTQTKARACQQIASWPCDCFIRRRQTKVFGRHS